MKYDKVVEMNQKIGKQNARIVEKEIERMIENGERVTVAALQRYTGFSNSFFYKNKLVREILYEAIRKQNQCYKNNLATVYKGNIIKNLIMDCQSYTKYRPNETTGGIFVSWRRQEELPTGA